MTSDVDKKKLRVAIDWISKLANGTNPIDGGNAIAEIRKHRLRYPERRKILVQILLIRKIYLHLQSQGEFA